MAKLNPVLLESITNDLEELHVVCKVMLTYVDEYDLISWKYPDKFCKDVEIDIDNDVYNEVEQYILLLELTIDRLYFITNMATHILDSLPYLSSVYSGSKNGQIVNDVSLGILISIFWKRLQALLYLDEVPQHQSKSEDVKVANQYTQTDNCSFSTCETCHMFIGMMKELINNIQQTTTIAKLPSVISSTRQIAERDLSKMTQFKAMQQWIDAVTADIHSLTELCVKHASENRIVQENLAKLKNQKYNKSRKLQDLKTKFVNVEEKLKSSEFKLSALSKSHSILELKHNQALETAASLEELHRKDLNQIIDLENQISKIKTENEKLLYETKVDHLNKIENLTNQRDHWAGLYATNQKFTEDLENKLNKLEEKYRNLETIYENDISQERTKITDYKTKSEAQETRLINRISELENEIYNQKNDFEKKIENLETHLEKLRAELEKSKEREMSLVQSPDLNGPITYLPGSKLDPITDMENQVKSNKVRIELLQTQNGNLQRTINKLRLLPPPRNANVEK